MGVTYRKIHGLIWEKPLREKQVGSSAFIIRKTVDMQSLIYLYNKERLILSGGLKDKDILLYYSLTFTDHKMTFTGDL